MSREEIIRLAESAGITVIGEAVWRLCELVAAAEREACAEVCEEFYSVEGIAQDCAEAIRARGFRAFVRCFVGALEEMNRISARGNDD